MREEGALYTDVDVTFDIVIDNDRCSSFKNVFVEAYLQKFTFFQREINFFFRREECLLFRHNRSPRQLAEESVLSKHYESVIYKKWTNDLLS